MTMQFFKDTFDHFLENKRIWLPFFPAFFILNTVMLFVEKMAMQESAQQMALQFFLIIISFIMAATLTIKFLAHFEEKDFSVSEYIVGNITFLMYNIGYLFILVLGIICFIVPGIVAGVLLSLAPIVALRESNVNAFKRSFFYLRSEWKIATILFFTSLFFEVWGFGLSLFDGSPYLLVFQFIFSFIDTIGSLFLINATVYLYRYVVNKNLHNP